MDHQAHDKNSKSITEREYNYRATMFRTNLKEKKWRIAGNDMKIDHT